MIYMFLSNNPSSGDIDSSNLPCFIYVPAGFSKLLLALILGGTSKSHVFEKICIHLV